MDQANRDLKHARHDLEDGDFEWACFSAQQAAEKALKGLYQKLGAEAWGHAVHLLLAKLPERFRPPEELLDLAKELDQHYIAPRYPNAHPQGAPSEYYTRGIAQRAIEYAERIVRFCQDLLVQP